MVVQKTSVLWLIGIAIAVGTATLATQLAKCGLIYNSALILIVAFLLVYFVSCAVFSPLNVFSVVSLLIVGFGSKLIINPVEGYYGGVGAGSFYLGTPHLVILLGLVSTAIHRKRFPTRTAKPSESIFLKNKPLLLFLGFCIISTVISPYTQASLLQLNFYLSTSMAYALLVYTFRRMDRLILSRLIIRTLAFLVFAELFMCLLQIMKGNELGLNFLGEGIVEGRPGIAIPSITGTFRHPGPLSLFFAVSMTIFFPFMLQMRNRIAMIGFIGAAIGLILTFSRTSLVMVVPLLLLEWVLLSSGGARFSKKKLFLIVIIGILIATMFGNLIVSRFTSLKNDNQDFQVDNRLMHIQMAWEYIKVQPIFGYGLSSWSYVTNKLQLQSPVGNFAFFYDNPVHNMYLYLWFEGGVLLLGSFLLLVGTALVRLGRQTLKGNVLEGGLFTAFICMLIYGMTGWGLFNGGQLLYLFFLLLSLANQLVLSNQQKPISSEIRSCINHVWNRHYRNYRI